MYAIRSYYEPEDDGEIGGDGLDQVLEGTRRQQGEHAVLDPALVAQVGARGVQQLPLALSYNFV